MSDINELVVTEVNRRLSDPVYLRDAVLHLTELLQSKDAVIQSREREIEALAPVKDFYERVTNSDNWMEMAAAVKVLAYKGYGRNKVFCLLRDREVLRWNNQPFQRYVENGYFKTIEEIYEDSYGRTGVYYKTMISQKGLDFIRKLIEEDVAA